jgi:hypothetical protein
MKDSSGNFPLNAMGADRNDFVPMDRRNFLQNSMIVAGHAPIYLS